LCSRKPLDTYGTLYITLNTLNATRIPYFVTYLSVEFEKKEIYLEDPKDALTKKSNEPGPRTFFIICLRFALSGGRVEARL